MRRLSLTIAVCALAASALASQAAADVHRCRNQRGVDGTPIWKITVKNTTCAAVRPELAGMVLWRFAEPGWRPNRGGFPTRWAPPTWWQCTQLGLWVRRRDFVDSDVIGSRNRCVASHGRVLHFSVGRFGPWFVHKTGCHQACPVTRTRP